ncbi:MAG: hypothetical protein NDJ89_08670 [Oligoflexia bacterium]|nr:hypothetical protein [Oligoflexia bacterium]
MSPWVALLLLGSSLHFDTLTYAAEKGQTQLYARVGAALEHFSDLPLELSRASVAPPVVLGLSFESPPEGGRGGGWGDLHFGTPRHALEAILGGGIGVWIDLKPTLLGFGIEFESQSLLTQAPVRGTPLEGSRWAAVARLQSRAGLLRPFADFKILSFNDVTLSEAEGIQTEISWNLSYLLRPGVRFELGPILAEGSLGIYSLGAAAIASDQFGYYIGQQAVYRPEAGAGVRLGAAELWLRAAAVFPTRSDSEEFLLQAPVYLNDYLMARKSLFAEVRCEF